MIDWITHGPNKGYFTEFGTIGCVSVWIEEWAETDCGRFKRSEGRNPSDRHVFTVTVTNSSTLHVCSSEQKARRWAEQYLKDLAIRILKTID